MIINVEGTPVHVPACWPNYTERQKLTVITWVQELREVVGGRLHSARVNRLVPRGNAGIRFRIDGGYSTT